MFEGLQKDKDNTSLSHIQKLRRFVEAGAPMTAKGVQDYEIFLNLDISSLKGKLVLDIGSGRDEAFSKQAAKLGIKVVSMSPGLKNSSVVHEDSFQQDWQRFSVAARAQEMPFPDATFDCEIAMFSVPYYSIHNFDEYKTWTMEIIRTLKIGGKAYISPVFVEETKILKAALDSLSSLAKYTCEPIDSDPEFMKILGEANYFVITKNN